MTSSRGINTSPSLKYAALFVALTNPASFAHAFTSRSAFIPGATNDYKRKMDQSDYFSIHSALSMSTVEGTLKKACTLDGKRIRGPITPLGNFVLVRTKDTLDATDGGILLPDESKERPTEGEVVAAGPGKLHPHTGVRITCPITAGNSVLFGKFDGHDMNYNEEKVTMIRDDDILLYYQGVRMTMENVIPCRDYILVELTETKTETASGIVVAEAVVKDYEPCEGKVVKIGEGRMTSTGKFSPSPVKVGDRVKFRDYAGNGVKIEGVEHSLVRMVDVLCALEE